MISRLKALSLVASMTLLILVGLASLPLEIPVVTPARVRDLLLPEAHAQSPSIVYQALALARTTTGTLGPVRNIGQINHQLLVVVTEVAGGNLCGEGTMNIGLEGSHDNLIWARIGWILTGADLRDDSPAGNPYGLVKADGNFPYIRVNLRAFDTAQCILDVYYTGMLQSSAEPFRIRSYSEQAAAGTATFTILPALATAKPVLYGFSLWNTAAISTYDIRCGGTTNIFRLTNHCVNCGFLKEPGPAPAFIYCLDGQALDFVGTNAAAVRDVFAWARYE